MKKTKTAKTAKTAKAAKTKRKPPVRRQVRNAPDDRALSFDAAAKDDMPKQAKPAPRQRVRASIDRVMAECDKVDAALIAMTLTTQDDDLPPLVIQMLRQQEIETADGEAATRGWAVVSGDPGRPLTERQAKHIIAAMQPLEAAGPITIAAESGRDAALHLDDYPR